MLGEFVPGMNIIITAEVMGAIKELNKLNGALEKTKLSVTSVGSTVGKASGLVLTAFVAIAAGAEMMSKKVETANALLANSYSNLGFNAKQLMPIAEQTEQTMIKLGFTTASTASALQILTTGLGSPTAALKYIGVAADFARVRTMGLEEASTAIVRAAQGQARAFKPIGVSFNEGTTAAEKFTIGMNKVTKSVNGASEAYAKTTSGGLDIMKAKAQDAVVVLGNALAPILVWIAAFITSVFIPAIKSLAKWFDTHTTAVKYTVIALGTLFIIGKALAWYTTFMGIITGLIGVYKALRTAIILAAAAQLTLEEIFSLGAATLVGIAAAAAAVKFIDTMNKMDTSMKDTSGTASDFAKQYAEMMKLIGDTPIKFPGAATGAAGTSQATIKTAKDIQNVFESLGKTVSDISKQIAQVFSYNLGNKIQDSFLNPIDAAYKKLTLSGTTYQAQQNKLAVATLASTKASLDHAKALDALNLANTKLTAQQNANNTKTIQGYQNAVTAAENYAEKMSNAAKTAGDAATQAASDTQQAIQDVMAAQDAYAQEVLNRVQGFRDAFAAATKIDIGGIAGNISAAKKEVADAQAALDKAQQAFLQKTKVSAYSGVQSSLTLPIFTAEQAALTKAKDDLAIALGQASDPFAATSQELITALQNQYDKATKLSINAGQLAAAGFSQDFITQILNSGLDMGNSLSSAILSSSSASQNALMAVYNSLDTVSQHGVDTLAVTLNKGAIDAMNSFITGFKSVQPALEEILKSIEASFAAMAGNILAAIKALMDQINTLTKVVKKSTGPTGGGDVTQAMIDTGTGYISSTGVKSTDLNAGTWAQYYTGTSGGLYGSTPVNPGPSTPSYDPLSGMKVVVNASTNASASDIAAQVGFVIRSNADATYGLASAQSTGTASKFG